MSNLNGKGSGSSPIAATADYNLPWAPQGTIIVADGFGNIASSEVPINAGTSRVVQAARIEYTPNPTDTANGYANIVVTWSVPFSDTNYTITNDEGLGAVPVWVPDATIDTGAAVLDANGMLQYATTGGVTGASVPSWNTVAGNDTSDGTVTWTLYPLGWISYVSAIKEKTPQGFVAEIYVYLSVPLVLNTIAVHD